MLKESVNNQLEYVKLSKEEMESRGILGRLVGVCADFMNPTRNGRKYGQDLWEKVFASELMQERIANGVCLGELGHPCDREETDMEKVAICLAEPPQKGKDGKLRAVFDILSTPNGKILKSLCDYGSTLGISSRGTGDIIRDYDGNEIVDPDTYSCEGFDIVLLPGVKAARLQYVTESLSKTRYNKTLKQKLTESINKEDENNQRIMRESLHDIGIDLDESLFDGLENNSLNESLEVPELANSINGVMSAYQNANKWLDSVKEFIYTDLSCPFFSSFVHELAHTMPGRFDKFGDILHTMDIEIPYPTTLELDNELVTIDDAFAVIFGCLDSIKDNLNDFIKLTDEEFHGMACSAEELLNDIEQEYPMLFRLRDKWNQCNGDLVDFDKFVAQYVEHKEDLLESLGTLNEEMLSAGTPYMLRNDGECIKCSPMHPYIKDDVSKSDSKNLKELIEGAYNFSLRWYYHNTNQNEVREYIKSLISSVIACEDYEYTEEDFSHIVDFDYSTDRVSSDKLEIASIYEMLNSMTNQEFCRIRTSNMIFGGTSGDLYCRISSVGFNWFDIIYRLVLKNKDFVTTVTICKDGPSLGGANEFYSHKGEEFSHMPINDFLTLSGNPLVEKIDSACNLDNIAIKALSEGKNLDESYSGMHPRNALAYFNNLRESYVVNNFVGVLNESASYSMPKDVEDKVARDLYSLIQMAKEAKSVEDLDRIKDRAYDRKVFTFKPGELEKLDREISKRYSELTLNENITYKNTEIIENEDGTFNVTINDDTQIFNSLKNAKTYIDMMQPQLKEDLYVSAGKMNDKLLNDAVREFESDAGDYGDTLTFVKDKFSQYSLNDQKDIARHINKQLSESLDQSKIEKAQKIADKNLFDGNSDTDIGFEFEGKWIINPWMDASGRFTLTDEEAIETYGKNNIDKFIELANSAQLTEAQVGRDDSKSIEDVGAEDNTPEPIPEPEKKPEEKEEKKETTIIIKEALNSTEENAADAALSELRAMKNVDKEIIRDVVADSVNRYNTENVGPDYEEDPFAFEEADYFRVLDYVENKFNNDVNNKEIINKTVDNNEVEVDEIYEMFNKNASLEKKLTDLQEQLSASYARETKLREELGRAKNQVRQLAESSKQVGALEKKLERANFQISEIENGISANEHKLNESLENSNKVKSKLTESIRQRDSRIKSLEEELESTKKQNVTQINENKTLRKEYDSLQESYADAQKDVAQLKEQYSKKLNQKNELIEKYQKIANRAVDKYIESQAIKLGVTSNEIKNKLPKGYGFKDIDSVCESLQGYKLNMSTLPFSTSSLNEGVSLKARNVRRELLPRNEENEITDLELELASKMLK